MLIWVNREEDYFRERDWTGQITLKLFKKIARTRALSGTALSLMARIS